MPREPSYAAQLGAVLGRRDAAALRLFLMQAAERFGDERQVADVRDKSDAEMDELLHRMILSRSDLSELHRASREWLFRHGIDAFGATGERRN
ncbi:MAG: hypothetical protein JO020_04425 [Chloroflexi bacterium]|nr:hypothetical protein [Chloroflexota bacterium]